MKYILHNTFIFSPPLQASRDIKLVAHLPSFTLAVQNTVHAQITDIIILIVNIFIYYFMLSDLVHSSAYEDAILTARGPPIKEV